MCCGRRIPKIVNKRVVTVEKEDGPVGQPVYMQYTGTRVGGFSIDGPVTKRSYRVNAASRAMFVVDSDDAMVLAQRPDLKIVSRLSEPAPTVTIAGEGAAVDIVRQIAQRFPPKRQSPRVPDRGTTKVSL
jgi:hypothetical protein